MPTPNDVIRAEKLYPSILRRVLRLYPRFLDRSKDSVNYRHIATMTSPLRHIETQICLLRHLLSLERPIMIWRSQSKPGVYTIHFRVKLEDIRSVEIYMEAEGDGEDILLYTTGDLLPGENTFAYEYVGTTREIIPTERFYVQVRTWRGVYLAKGFPENDTPQGDIYDHDRALDVIGEWLGVGRHVYDNILSEDELPHTTPPYNASRTEWDYTYKERIKEYMELLQGGGFLDAEIYRIFQIKVTAEGGWRYCAFQDEDEPQDEKYMEDDYFGYNTIWVHGDRDDIPRNIYLAPPEVLEAVLTRAATAGKDVLFEVISDREKLYSTPIISDSIDIYSHKGPRRFTITDMIEMQATGGPSAGVTGLSERIGASPTGRVRDDAGVLERIGGATTSNIWGVGGVHERMVHTATTHSLGGESLLLTDSMAEEVLNILLDLMRMNMSVGESLAPSVTTPIGDSSVATEKIQALPNVPIRAVGGVSEALSSSTSASMGALGDVIGERVAPSGSWSPVAVGAVDEMIVGSYDATIKSADSQSEWGALTLGGNATTTSDGKLTVSINPVEYDAYRTGSNAFSDGSGDVSWVNPGYARAHDGNFARADTSTSRRTTDRLVVNGFGFSVPTNSRVMQVQLAISKKQSSTVDLHDNGVRLYRGPNDYSPDNKAKPDAWPQTNTTYYYGSGYDTWGFTPSQLTPAVVNSSSFGAYISAYNASSYAPSAYVDSIRMGVWWRRAATGTASYTFDHPGGDMGTVTLYNCYQPANTRIDVTLYEYIDTWIPMTTTSSIVTTDTTKNITLQCGIQDEGQYKVEIKLSDAKDFADSTGTAPTIDRLEHRVARVIHL